MVGLAIIFDRQFPVTAHVDEQPGMCGAGTQLLPSTGAHELARTLLERADVTLEVRSVSAQIDENYAHEFGAAHSFEAVLGVVEALDRVPVHAADMGCGLQISGRRVTPTVVAAVDDALHVGRLRHELHAAVAAHVMKYAQHAAPVTGDEEREAHELERLGIGTVRDRVREGETRPSASDHVVAFMGEIIRIDVGGIWQPGSLSDRTEHLVQAIETDGICVFGNCHGYTCLRGMLDRQSRRQTTVSPSSASSHAVSSKVFAVEVISALALMVTRQLPRVMSYDCAIVARAELGRSGWMR